MLGITIDDAIGQILGVLKEAFEGPPEQWSYFTDRGEDAGLFNALEKLNAEEASRIWSGTSIAAHTHHVLFGLEASTGWISGDRSPRNWEESWSVSSVDHDQWQAMQEELRSRYEALCSAIQSGASASMETIGGAIAALAHAAYHLGVIRQKILAGYQP